MQIQLPAKFQPLFRSKRIKVFYGGRGGAKTVSYSKAAIFMAAKRKMRFLCLREFMNSIDDSVHAALSAEVDALGMGRLYTILNNQINGSNGSAFRYGQLSRNLESIKSKFDFDVAWVEEAETCTERSLDVLEPTIRKSGSELWYSFNPCDEMGAVYSRYVKPNINDIQKHGFYEDDDLFVCKVGLEDNPWAPEELISASRKMKEQNPRKWAHIYGGQPNMDFGDSIIQPEWVDAAIDAHQKLGFEGLGKVVIGFDPADCGADSKAVAHRIGSVVNDVFSWDDGDIEDAISKAFAYSFANRADCIVYDSVGLGAAVKVGLSKRIAGRNIQVDGFGGGDGVRDPLSYYEEDRQNRRVFKNLRAQWWWYLRDRFEKTYRAVKKGEYIDPDELISLSSEISELDQLKGELCRVRRKRGTSNSLILLESKEEMRRRGVRSPNLADSLVMAFANKVDDIMVVDINFDSEW